jgi:RHS repeat-associated protein
LYREIFWLISDHLGTPRMIAERTGKLEGIKRSDYLPFGESANALGGRATSQGYASESVRQGFTGYEEDAETGLDYAQARYYAISMGRFIQADPLFIELKRLADPQRINLYAYVRNNPLAYIDPLGLEIVVTGSQQDEYNKRLQEGLKFKTAIIDKKVTIVDDKGNPLDQDALKKLGANLKGADLGIFNAITKKPSATIDTGDGKDNPDVLFGQSNGQTGSGNAVNTLDISDIKQLDDPSNKGGVTGSQFVKHETFEAFQRAAGKEQTEAHDAANAIVGYGLDKVSSQGITNDGNRTYAGATITFSSVVGTSIKPSSTVSYQATMQYATPVPAQTFKSMQTLPNGEARGKLTSFRKVNK